MKKIATIFTVLFLLAGKSIFAQCDFQWGTWNQAISTNQGIVSYQMQYSRCTNDGICGWPKIAIKHTFPANAFVDIRLRGINCDGQEITRGFNTSLNCSPHQEYVNSGNWHLFKKVLEVVYVKAEFKANGKEYTVLFDKERGINKVNSKDLYGAGNSNSNHNTNFNKRPMNNGSQNTASDINQLKIYQQQINQLQSKDNSQEIIDMGTLLGNSVQDLIKVLSKEEQEDEEE